MTTTATIARTDQEIQTDVLAELRWDHSVQANEIGVAVKNGVVTLTGTVDTYLKKWKAIYQRQLKQSTKLVFLLSL